jgi:hypothetical protein
MREHHALEAGKRQGMGHERVYAGSTRSPPEVLGRQRSLADSLDSCGLDRLGATGDDTCSTLVMKGSPVRVRASALSISRDLLSD